MTPPRPPAGGREVRALLSARGLSPRKHLGQNFVVDPNTVHRVVRDAELPPGALVCEIGPGLGSLTLALRQAGHPVVAVEIDPELARILTDELAAGDTGLRVVVADAVGTDLTAVVTEAAAAFGVPPDEVCFVANLPYNAATPIIMNALRSGAFSRLLAMVQKEAGQRWVADVGDDLYGAVSVKVAAFATARIAGKVSRQAFHPVPNVDSVTVRLDPVGWVADVDRERVLTVVVAGFSQRRKKLRNTLGAIGHAPAAVEAALDTAGLARGARAEELDLAAWIDLTVALG